MIGINLNKPIFYRSASFRYFAPGEHHIRRICSSNVLLLVFEGVLRFNENGKDYEIHAGEYYIQKKNGVHTAPYPSDGPKYLYAHFDGEWQTDGDNMLPISGRYNYRTLSTLMSRLDQSAHENASYIIQASHFYQILSLLYQEQADKNISPNAQSIANYIESNYINGVTLPELCDKFGFSKNHIIKLIKKAYGMTPIDYLNSFRLQKAEALLEITSEKAEYIAAAVGFNNYSHFYRLFYKRSGVSPNDFRIRKRGQ